MLPEVWLPIFIVLPVKVLVVALPSVQVEGVIIFDSLLFFFWLVFVIFFLFLWFFLLWLLFFWLFNFEGLKLEWLLAEVSLSNGGEGWILTNDGVDVSDDVDILGFISLADE